MFAVRAGETVITVESRAGTEEEIVVILEVQHPVDRSDRRHRDRRRRQPLVQIGVIRRRGSQVLVQNPAKRKMNTIVELSFRKHYNIYIGYELSAVNLGQDKFDKYINIVDIIKIHLQSIIEIRNKSLVERMHKYYSSPIEAPSHVNFLESVKIIKILQDSLKYNNDIKQAYEMINRETNYGELFYNNLSIDLQKEVSIPKSGQRRN